MGSVLNEKNFFKIGVNLMAFFGGGASASNMVGATSSAAGTAGLVPAPAAGNSRRTLLSTATFAEPFLTIPYKNVSSGVFMTPYGMFYYGASNSGALTIRRRQFIPVFFPSDGKVDVLAVRTSSAAWSGGAVNIHLAIWECGEDGLPSTYVGGGTITSGTATNTTISLSITPAQIYRGFYFFSITPEAATTGGFITFNAVSTIFLGNFFGSAGFPLEAANMSYPYYSATSYNQTTHETFTINGSGGLPPIIIYQYE